jgi:hypothetical protein
MEEVWKKMGEEFRCGKVRVNASILPPGDIKEMIKKECKAVCAILQSPENYPDGFPEAVINLLGEIRDRMSPKYTDAFIALKKICCVET